MPSLSTIRRACAAAMVRLSDPYNVGGCRCSLLPPLVFALGLDGDHPRETTGQQTSVCVTAPLPLLPAPLWILRMGDYRFRNLPESSSVQ